MTVTETPSATRRWAGLAVLSAGLLLVVMDMTILNVALPAIAADLRPDAISQLWIVDVYSLVVSGLLVGAAALGDRWGRRRVLILGFVLFGTASTLVLWAESPAAVIAVRALLGAGGAMIMPSTLSMIRTLFSDPRERATALGVWSAMAAVGAALGPVLGGLLLEHFSWHAAFLVNVPVMAVAIVAGLLLLPESRNPRPGRWDAVATVLSIVGMVALVYAIKHLSEGGLAEPGTPIALVVAAVTLGWFAARCLRRPDPLLDLRLFAGRPFTAGVVTALATAISMAGVLLLLTQWMQLVRDYSPLESGIRLVPAALAAAVASPLAPALAARIGARGVVAGGLAVTGLGFLALVAAPLGYLAVAAGLTFIGLGQGSLAIASAMIMAGAPPERSGNAAAMEETSYELGGALGVAVLGSVAAAVYRAGLPSHAPAAARESLAGALGGPLAVPARQAFEQSLAVAGVCGAVLMLVTAAVVWRLAPRRLSAQH
ncbi:MFS transporter [Thermoactinospora rubra]|uniref:MFS transporter n=1 Tax=Thermoactinospora rubra TaxID=1088767 RepID=UPI001F0A7F6B|nr:MFS transporter [Thermoactinospora rubra]